MNDVKTLEWAGWLAARSIHESYGEDPDDSLLLSDLESARREMMGRLERLSLDRPSRMGDAQRLCRIREHIGWADAALRPDLRDLLARFVKDVGPRLVSREEAIAFCAYLEAQPPPMPVYLRELVRYERVRISVAWGLVDAHRVELFQYSIPAILEALREPGWPEAARRPTFLEFRKVPYLPAAAVRQRILV